MTNRTPEDLDTGLAHVLDAPRDVGEIVMIVRRPGEDEREVLDEGVLDAESGLMRDSWEARGDPRSEIGRRLRLRGINTRVVKAGTIRVGDRVKKAHGDAGGVYSSDAAYTALS